MSYSSIQGEIIAEAMRRADAEYQARRELASYAGSVTVSWNGNDVTISVPDVLNIEFPCYFGDDKVFLDVLRTKSLYGSNIFSKMQQRYYAMAHTDSFGSFEKNDLVYYNEFTVDTMKLNRLVHDTFMTYVGENYGEMPLRLLVGKEDMERVLDDGTLPDYSIEMKTALIPIVYMPHIKGIIALGSRELGR